MNLIYPKTSIKPVVENMHGYEIVDDYRWLEDMDNPNTQEWIFSQNQLSRGIFDNLPQRRKLVKYLSDYLDYEKYEKPYVCGEWVFYLRRKKGYNQPVLCYRKESEPESSEKVLIDPNVLSAEGTVSLDWWYPSFTGKRVAFGLSKNGDEWSTLYILDTKNGILLEDQIPRTRYASIVWNGDEGFYYTRYPEPGEVAPGEENYNIKLYYHEVGTNYKDDQLVLGEGISSRAMIYVHSSTNNRYMMIYIEHGWSRNDLYIADLLDEKLRLIPVIKDLNALFFGDIVDNQLYLLTNYKAGNYKVISINLTKLKEKRFGLDDWETVIPESTDSILNLVSIAGDKIIVNILKDVVSYLKVYDTSGKFVGDVELPDIGTVNTITQSDISGDVYLVFQSFNYPPSIYRLNMKNLRLTKWAGLNPDVNEKRFLIQQKFYNSKDGKKVPMFIIHKPDIILTGDTPTVLFGYGGFNSGVTPLYNPAISPWLDNGGIYAIANIRGGNEYGEDWHREGMRENKQNVFDDFIYAAKFLIKEGYTDPTHLGIHGRSNGGLLVGAVMTQAPQLFEAVVCGVPLLDMLRYHKFLIGALWIAEYGNPDNPEEFEWLYKYSPYHNVKENTNYPSVFFYTAAADSRVHPLHALKMTAKLQKATASERPVLLNVEFEAGHGVGKPLTKIIAEQADIWSFLAWRLGLEIN